MKLDDNAVVNAVATLAKVSDLIERRRSVDTRGK